MTEQEAKTKWCPMYRQAVSIDGANREWADNRMDGSNPTCIGSACMAWRWFQPGRDPDLAREFPLAPTGDLDKRDDVGFCGLAGKP